MARKGERVRTGTKGIGRPGHRGFTLIELLVVLAILSGLSAAFPLAWQRLSPQRQVQVYARRLVADLGWLRAESMRTNTVAELRLVQGGHTYQLFPDGTGRDLPEAIKLNLSGADPAAATQDAALRFFPDGSSTGGSVVLDRDGRTAQLAISPLSGRVREE